MLKDLALRIFEVLERPLEDRGILLVEQLPDLIAKLEKAIEADAILRKTIAEDENSPKLPDRLGQRAHPFLKLMQTSLKNQDPVVWGD